MKTFTVALFGHRYIENYVEMEKALEKLVKQLLAEKEYVEFLVGRNGEFDIMAAAVIYRVKRAYKYNNSALVLVLPYMTAEYIKNEKSFSEIYDEIEVPDIASKVYHKAAIGVRNREMADRADLIISFVEKESGGAYEAVKYGDKRGKKIINIAYNI